jgi:hypothetical protein
MGMSFSENRRPLFRIMPEGFPNRQQAERTVRA